MSGDAPMPRARLRRTLGEYADPSLDDDALAVRIRVDARSWIDRGARLDLQEYLDAIPRLEQRRLPFDAAIDVVVKSRSRTPMPDPEVVESLVEQFPRHQRTIRDAAAISGALWATHHESARPSRRAERPLPQAFGPALKDGEPRYRLVELLDSGATADVYRAIDRHLSETDRPAVVAIKVFLSGRDRPADSGRTAEEAARARSISHPNVVRIYDHDESDQGESYIVQEFVDGGNLHRWRARREGRARARESAAVLLGLARGVQAVHARGLVHLDLKPANVLLTAEGVPKISDFGLASRENVAAGPDGEAGGTAGFMSPERFFGEPGAMAPQADVYSLGGILHWMLTGELPNGDTIEAIAESHRAGRVNDAALERAQRDKLVDRDLAAVCRRALEPAPRDRCQSAADLARDLESWLEREPIRWTRPSATRKLRLFAVRHPALLAMALVLGAAIIASGIAIEVARHYSSVARTEALEARANAELIEAERAWKKRSSRNLDDLIAAFLDVKQTGLAGEVLTSLWMLEWVQGPAVLNKEEDFPKLWSVRTETVEGLLEERRAEGGAESFDALQFEALLAFWRLQNDEYAEAEPLIEHSLGAWRERLDPDDPWLKDLEAIRDCAAVDRHLAEHAGRPLSGPSRERALELERSLRRNYTRLADRDDGAQLRLLIIKRLQKLYAPAALANGAWLEWANEHERHLGLSLRGLPY